MKNMSPIKQIRSSGFTLIEMMIALTVGLFVLGALVAVLSSAGRSTKSNDQTSEMQSNGRYALNVILRDVQHAGQSGLTPSATLLSAQQNGFFNIASGVSATNDCDSSNFALRLEQPVAGSDNSNPYSATCIPSANYSTGDILVVRYADMQNLIAVNPATATTPPAFSVTNDIFLRSSYAVSTLFKNGTAPYQIGTGPMQDQLLKTYVYYISPNTTGADGIPALYRLNLTAGNMNTTELVASGIENLQVQYGVVDASGNTQYVDASAMTSWPSKTFPSWTQVKSVRVWLLARNSDSKGSGGYSNQTSYQMGNVNFVPTVGTSDKFRRQLFMTTISLRN
jgi:type IV pilus assembly protein PilW